MQLFCQGHIHHHAHKIFHTCDSLLTSSNINIFQKSFQLELLLCQTGNCEKFQQFLLPRTAKVELPLRAQASWNLEPSWSTNTLKYIQPTFSGKVNLGWKLCSLF